MDPKNSKELVNKDIERSGGHKYTNLPIMSNKKNAYLICMTMCCDSTSSGHHNAGIGAQSMYMLVALSMQSFTYFMRDFGTRFFIYLCFSNSRYRSS